MLLSSYLCSKLSMCYHIALTSDGWTDDFTKIAYVTVTADYSHRSHPDCLQCSETGRPRLCSGNWELTKLPIRTLIWCRQSMSWAQMLGHIFILLLFMRIRLWCRAYYLQLCSTMQWKVYSIGLKSAVHLSFVTLNGCFCFSLCVD